MAMDEFLLGEEEMLPLLLVDRDEPARADFRPGGSSYQLLFVVWPKYQEFAAGRSGGKPYPTIEWQESNFS